MTRHSYSPSKKMVPSLSSEHRCPHRFVEEDVMTLEIDCGDCSGAQRLENPKCASGVVNILAGGLAPEVVVLKRYVHTRYRLEAILRLRESASALAALRRLEAEPREPSDKKCLTCPASRRRLASEIIRTIRADPVSFCASRRALSDNLTSLYSATACPRVPECVSQVVWSGIQGQGGR